MARTAFSIVELGATRPRALPRRTGLLRRLACATALALAAGCQEPAVEAFVPRHPSDVITPQELEAFLAVVSALSEEKLPAWPPLWTPVSSWSRTRTLPVAELARLEGHRLEERASIEWIAAHCARLPAFDRALRAQKLTREQFAGLYAAFTLAVARDAVPPQRDLARLAVLAQKTQRELARDQRVFATLRDEDAFAVQAQAAWIVIAHRAGRLTQVHPRNLELVRRNKERLLAALPQEAAANPFAEFASILDARGVPFMEPPGGPSDDQFALPGVAGMPE